MTGLEQAASSTIVSAELPVCAHGDTFLLILQIPDRCTENVVLFQWIFNRLDLSTQSYRDCCRYSAIYMSLDLNKREDNLLQTTASLLRY